MAEWGHGATN
uniref:Uncharacterized protein n=1 Tax=Nymphaea colorata TaxID=210225 RepID=A0A5K0X3U5_9MAGN